MMNSIPDCLTERHLLLFGTIVQWFAQYELLMQRIMAAAAGADSACIRLLTRGLDFSGKREALLDLLRHRTIPLDQFDRINDYLTVAHTFTPLRNDIAHSTWKPGSSSSSWIQPDWVLRTPSRVKPLHNDPGVGGEDFVERAEDKLAYSLKDLDETVETLAANYANLSGYLLQIGLIPQAT